MYHMYAKMESWSVVNITWYDNMNWLQTRKLFSKRHGVGAVPTADGLAIIVLLPWDRNYIPLGSLTPMDLALAASKHVIIRLRSIAKACSQATIRISLGLLPTCSSSSTRASVCLSSERVDSEMKPNI